MDFLEFVLTGILADRLASEEEWDRKRQAKIDRLERERARQADIALQLGVSRGRVSQLVK